MSRIKLDSNDIKVKVKLIEDELFEISGVKIKLKSVIVLDNKEIVATLFDFNKLERINGKYFYEDNPVSLRNFVDYFFLGFKLAYDDKNYDKWNEKLIGYNIK